MRERKIRWQAPLFFAVPICLCVFWHTRCLTSAPRSDFPAFSKRYASGIRAHRRNYSHDLDRLSADDYSRLVDIDFTFTVLNGDCDERVFLLVLVHSSPGNFERRRVVRETWGGLGPNTTLVFLLGMVESDLVRAALRRENLAHRDLIQGDFLDVYRNLTYKHMMGLKYGLYHCPRAKYILKTDDDVFVNAPLLRNSLANDLSDGGAVGVLLCNPKGRSAVLRSYRSKWRVGFDEYPDREYPSYCMGWAIVYSPDVAFGLYETGQRTRYFWIDDVHVTGTLALENGFSHADLRDFVISADDLSDLVRYGTNPGKKFLFGRPDLGETEIRALWRFVAEREAPASAFDDP
ncbi:beta-1,3-galactosyltransferase 5-like [Cylas formicarius]|uniref:beta-1,3-galactosyltransferase 5-like n=1 Tax=Cylas formicarius TaxID=197179 RepID=UPI002958B3D7|nr:beta-1,3-galactosyltransferase 5-like [Cylas formicarius]XP_060519926.1 beta-1,3-galactosyltransferase 5-like [Cylas formicarius]XP_060519927.1 beta-1,3-galactosyltransferase 5-like [Cylas formicarius]